MSLIYCQHIITESYLFYLFTISFLFSISADCHLVLVLPNFLQLFTQVPIILLPLVTYQFFCLNQFFVFSFRDVQKHWIFQKVLPHITHFGLDMIFVPIIMIDTQKMNNFLSRINKWIELILINSKRMGLILPSLSRSHFQVTEVQVKNCISVLPKLYAGQNILKLFLLKSTNVLAIICKFKCHGF